MSPMTPRCHKRSLSYCPNRAEHRHDVCGEEQFHDVPSQEDLGSGTPHKCAWCATAYTQAQTTEGGA